MDAIPGIPQFIGVRVRRREDPALITGQGQYVADIPIEGLLHMAVVRSPYAHARIVSIDTSAAEAMEGVVAVLTGEDINPHLALPLPMIVPMGDQYSEKKNPARYPLTVDKARHVGDPVAVVVAESAYIAADAAEAVHVDYEPLDAVVDAEKALAEGAPIIHETWNDNLAFRWSSAGGEDVDEIFAAAEHVTELRLVNQRVLPNAMEPRAVAATYDAETESLTVWTSTQVPHGVKGHLVAILNTSAEKVRVIAPEVGGGFGAKSNIFGEEVMVPFLARKFDRPIRWVATRTEDILAISHGRDQINIVRLAADKNGRVNAVDLKLIMNVGGYYTSVTPIIVTLSAMMMTGVYDIQNARIVADGVFTNKHPSEPYRGAGRPEAAYMIERAMDLLADELGLDPVDVRRRNFITPDKFPYTTAMHATYDSGEYARNLDKALELVDYKALRAEQARRRQNGGKLMGIGLACYVEVCGFGPWEAGGVFVDEDAKVTILTGSSPHGQGHETAWAQIAADILQVPMVDITVKHGDTAVVPRGIGTFGSRSAPVGGSAVLDNSQSVRERAIEIAAHLLEAAPGDMTVVDGRFHVQGVPDRSVTWKEVAQAAHGDSLPEALQGGLSADTDFQAKGETFPFGTHVAVVEIDPDTGQVTLARYLTVDDCGRVINPMLVEGQVHGGIAQGAGQALLEEAIYDEMGNLLTGTFMDYAMPRATNFPSYETNRTETPSPLNPLGVKGIGEAATIGSTPTVANAVIDALSQFGVRHVDMPFTAEKVWQQIHQHA